MDMFPSLKHNIDDDDDDVRPSQSEDDHDI
jgi:hypothetical protein